MTIRGRPQEATVVVADVYQGLDGVPRGTVKYLRVMEQVPRPWSVYLGYQPSDASPGQMVAVSLYTHLSVKVLHGVVPVRGRRLGIFHGAGRPEHLPAALDEDFMEVQRMRTFVNFQPGECRSASAATRQRSQRPARNRPRWRWQPPARPRPQPGETAPAAAALPDRRATDL